MRRLRCPCCDRGLVERRPREGAVRVDVCPICRGIWFDGGELEEVLRAADEELSVPEDAEESQRHCPRCRCAMYEFRYPDTAIEIDMCDRCLGVWLDDWELRELELLRSGVDRALLRLIGEAISYVKS
jgi:Zn-finger nucleic acid-binding protein